MCDKYLILIVIDFLVVSSAVKIFMFFFPATYTTSYFYMCVRAEVPYRRMDTQQQRAAEPQLLLAAVTHIGRYLSQT